MMRAFRSPVPWLLVALMLLLPLPAAGGGASVPVALQAKLMAKVAGYDRNLPARAGGRVRVGILTVPGNAGSERAAAQLKRALGAIDKIGGLAHEEVSLSYSGAPQLAKSCKRDKIAILYVTPGLSDHIGKVRAALSGVSILSVAAEAGYVEDGIVLGFELVSGKPKLVVNLPQAKRQKVNFSAGVLKLMKVIK